MEAHREYLDVQYVLEGQDTIGWAPVDALTPVGEFDAARLDALKQMLEECNEYSDD